jgi:hypothetical protein
VLGFMGRASARGAQVLIADPGRADLPDDSLEIIATYSTDGAAELADAEIENVYVLRPKRRTYRTSARPDSDDVSTVAGRRSRWMDTT